MTVNHDDRLTIRYRPSERVLLEAAAEREGVRLSEWVRRVTLAAARIAARRAQEQAPAATG